MGEKETAKKNTKPLIIALSVLLVIVSAYFVTSSILGKGIFARNVSGSELYAEEDGSDSENISPADQQQTDDEDKVDSEVVVTEPSDSSAEEEPTLSEGKNITKNLLTTINSRTEYANNDGVVSGGTRSSILSGAAISHRWTASNVISSVTAERIAVNLDVYRDGVKTGRTVKRFMYAAVIDTKPSRVVIPAAGQFSDKNLESVGKLVKAYENDTKEDILFAVNNEMCSRDYDNIRGNVFYNGDGAITGTVIKNSRIAQQGEACDQSLIINKDGTWTYPGRVSMSTANDLINRGTIASVSYTYPVIWHGEKYNHPEAGVNTGIWMEHEIAPDEDILYDNRTLIGKINNNKYVVLISEGFGYGYLAEYMLDIGVQDAYWANGGIAAAMYIKGHGLVTPNNYIVHGDLFCIK